MEFIGQIKGINQDFLTGDIDITFTVNEKQTILAEYDKLKGCEKLSIKVAKYRKKRSLNANGYLWTLLGEIAIALKSDKWSVYLQMLKLYGKYTYIVVKPNVVEAVKKQWRETEELGEIEINGQKAVQLLCYFGSSTYDTKEMSDLIDGVVNEAKELGIETLLPTELERIKKEWNIEII